MWHNCATSKKPDNTLFPDINCFRVGFNDMQEYFPLILALFEVSPECAFGFMHACLVSSVLCCMEVCNMHACMIYIYIYHIPAHQGEVSLTNFSIVFAKMDDDTGGNLSQSRYKKEKKQWATNDL